MKQLMLCAACLAGVAAALIAGMAYGQFRAPWQHAPRIAVIGSPGDPRLPAVNDAVSYWNRTFQQLGSRFRLGPVARTSGAVPEEMLQSFSAAVLDGGGSPAGIPDVFREPPGDITIYLAKSEFVSFTGPLGPNSKRIVAIRGAGFAPMNLPNVARNVIAHEIGHAIGLPHNSEPAMLMCGRPAPCRPDLFRSDRPRMFPLTDDEKRRLLAMYPP